MVSVLGSFEAFGRDLYLGARRLARTPLYSVVVVLAIAVAVGPNILVASVLSSLVLRPLPYADAGRLLFVQETNDGRSLNFPDAAKLARSAENVARFALTQFDARTLRDGTAAVDLSGAAVSANYFSLLGIEPELGRFFSATDGSQPIVISDRLWRSTFASSPSVLGRAVRLGEREYSIVGVAPTGFLDPTPYGLIDRSYWVPIDASDPAVTAPGSFNFNAVARVDAGVDVGAARASIVNSLSQLSRPAAAANPGFYTPRADEFKDVLLGPVAPLLWTMYAAVSIVLFIACANVANLQLSRQMAREKQFAIGIALGATRTRLALEMFSESFVVVAIGALLGIGIAWVAVTAGAEYVAQLFPATRGVSFDPGVAAYGLLLVPLIATLTGMYPALTCARNPAAALRGSGESLGRPSTGRFRAALVVSEIALATSLIVGAVLLFRSYVSLTHVNLGFQPDNLYVVTPPALSTSAYATNDAKTAYAAEIEASAGAIPGVRAIASASQIPFMCCSSTKVLFESAGADDGAGANVLYAAVGPSYFQTLETPVVRGRSFSDADRAGSEPVAIVDQVFAYKYYGRLDVVGRHLKESVTDSNQRVTIVGVVGSVRAKYGEEARPVLYLPFAQDPEPGVYLLRVDRRIEGLGGDVAAAFAKVDSNLAPPQTTVFADLLDGNSLAARTNVLLFGFIAAIAIFLAAAGIYAVTNYSVQQRSVEFAIRRALGARTWNIVCEMGGGTLRTSAIGIALGAVASNFLASAISGFLYQTPTFDPGSIAVAGAVIVALSLVATIGPAITATSRPIASALRSL